MKALRIKLHQTSANYRKEETIDNKMTYPLPPISTVTGALHSICGYTEYHKMLVSIQRNYQSMQNKIYTHHCFLNSTMKDRGLLVKMKNENLLSTAFDKVAEAKSSRNSDFLEGTSIQVYDQGLLEEYRNLRKLGDKIALWKKSAEYKEKSTMYKKKKEELKKQKNIFDKKSKEYEEIVKEEKDLKQEEKEWKSSIEKYEEIHYKKPIAKFRSLTKSVKKYEILNDITLILHIQAEEDVLKDIQDNIYNLKSLGRSEDFVDVEDIQFVNLEQDEESYRSCYSAYLNYGDVMNERINTGWYEDRDISGTKYYLGKKYDVSTGKRIFTEKVKVIYTSDFTIDETSENVWVDKEAETEDGQVYIVNFL